MTITYPHMYLFTHYVWLAVLINMVNVYSVKLHHYDVII